MALFKPGLGVRLTAGWVHVGNMALCEGPVAVSLIRSAVNGFAKMLFHEQERRECCPGVIGVWAV